MYPANPAFPIGPMNPGMPTAEQMTFAYTHYPKYTEDFQNIAANVTQMLSWLYSVA